MILQSLNCEQPLFYLPDDNFANITLNNIRNDIRSVKQVIAVLGVIKSNDINIHTNDKHHKLNDKQIKDFFTNERDRKKRSICFISNLDAIKIITDLIIPKLNDWIGKSETQWYFNARWDRERKGEIFPCFAKIEKIEHPNSKDIKICILDCNCGVIKENQHFEFATSYYFVRDLHTKLWDIYYEKYNSNHSVFNTKIINSIDKPMSRQNMQDCLRGEMRYRFEIELKNVMTPFFYPLQTINMITYD